MGISDAQLANSGITSLFPLILFYFSAQELKMFDSRPLNKLASLQPWRLFHALALNYSIRGFLALEKYSPFSPRLVLHFESTQ